MAAGFWDAGIRTGERVALMMGNCPEFLYTYYALVFMGVGAVPLNIAQRGDALAYILNDSGASAIVIDEGLLTYFNNIRERVPKVRLVIAHGSIPSTMSDAITVEEWLKAGGGRPPIDPHVGIPADNILYTSGTTGPPKGTINKGINPANIVKLWEPTGIRPGDTVYTSLPLFHGNALGVTTLGAIVLDYKLALGERYRSQTLMSTEGPRWRNGARTGTISAICAGAPRTATTTTRAVRKPP